MGHFHGLFHHLHLCMVCSVLPFINATIAASIISLVIVQVFVPLLLYLGALLLPGSFSLRRSSPSARRSFFFPRQLFSSSKLCFYLVPRLLFVGFLHLHGSFFPLRSRFITIKRSPHGATTTILSAALLYVGAFLFLEALLLLSSSSLRRSSSRPTAAFLFLGAFLLLGSPFLFQIHFVAIERFPTAPQQLFSSSELFETFGNSSLPRQLFSLSAALYFPGKSFSSIARSPSPR